MALRAQRPAGRGGCFCFVYCTPPGGFRTGEEDKKTKEMGCGREFFPLPQPGAVLLAGEKIRYSVRMAARGESRMAFMDGYKPETMATTTEKATAPALSHTGMTERMPISVSRPLRPAPRA